MGARERAQADRGRTAEQRWTEAGSLPAPHVRRLPEAGAKTVGADPTRAIQLFSFAHVSPVLAVAALQLNPAFVTSSHRRAVLPLYGEA